MSGRILKIQDVALVTQKIRSLTHLSDLEADQHPKLSVEERTVAEVPNEVSFARWVKRNGCITDYVEGKVIIREVSSLPRSLCLSEVSFIFQMQRGAIIDVLLSLDIRGRIGNNIRQPDVTVAIRGQSNRPGASNPGHRAYPGIIVEIATSQDPSDLHERANLFLGPECPGCEFYIGLKRYGVRTDDGLQAMLVTVYDRVSGFQPVRIISFGTGGLYGGSIWKDSPLLRGVGVPGDPPCNAPGIPLYIISFPAARVFATRVGGIPVGAPANFTLDLFPLHEALAQPMEFHC